jgi:hypothetical protein
MAKENDPISEMIVAALAAKNSPIYATVEQRAHAITELLQRAARIRAGELADTGDTLQRAEAVERLLEKAMRDAGEQDSQARLREICADAKKEAELSTRVDNR